MIKSLFHLILLLLIKFSRAEDIRMADVPGEPTLLSVDYSMDVLQTEQPIVSKAIHQLGTKVDEAPFYAAIYFKDKRRCSGAIVHEQYILTTGQCCDIADITNGLAHLHIGDIDAQTGLEIIPAAYIYDDRYNNVTKINDICIVQLRRKLTWSKSLQPLKLPQNPLPALAPVTLYAWDNDNQAEHLKNIELYMIEQTNCLQRFENLGNNTMLCAGDIGMNQGICGIESGAPLVADGTLYGLAASNLDCDKTTSQKPLVFSDIYRMMKFITTIMEENLID